MPRILSVLLLGSGIVIVGCYRTSDSAVDTDAEPTLESDTITSNTGSANGDTGSDTLPLSDTESGGVTDTFGTNTDVASNFPTDTATAAHVDTETVFDLPPTDTDTDGDRVTATDTVLSTDPEFYSVPGDDPSVCNTGQEYACNESCIRYVNGAIPESGSGESWLLALKTVQEGVDSAYCEAGNCGTICQIWVVAGVYYIYEANREDTVQLRPNIELYGGFTGTETLLFKRDWQSNATVLDGRAGVEDGRQVYSVVKGSKDVIIDGFTITGGQTEGAPGTNGGGMLNQFANPTVRNCIFEGNSAMPDGNGGAMANVDSSPLIESCIFKGNSADWGGAVFSNGWTLSAPRIINSLFIGNTAREGGAVYTGSEGAPSLINCTFSGNSAEYGGGIFQTDGAEGTVVNTIMWGDGLYDEIYVEDAAIDVSYSNIQGGWDGLANRDSDPLFTDPASDDYRLLEFSPCIDAATAEAAPEMDLAGSYRDPLPDIGAYERF